MIAQTGDPYLRVQRIDDARAGIHFDLHVGSIPGARDRALQLGATLVSDSEWVVMKSPGAMEFCLVTHRGESARTAPRHDPPHLLDQLSIDVPERLFEAELQFWAELTAWEVQPSVLDEFVRLNTPRRLPYRILLQRLGSSDRGAQTRAHLDIACGSDIDMVARRHEANGAINLGRRKYWVTMQDPAGLAYCLTPRDPVTGRVPPR